MSRENTLNTAKLSDYHINSSLNNVVGPTTPTVERNPSTNAVVAAAAAAAGPMQQTALGDRDFDDGAVSPSRVVSYTTLPTITSTVPLAEDDPNAPNSGLSSKNGIESPCTSVPAYSKLPSVKAQLYFRLSSNNNNNSFVVDTAFHLIRRVPTVVFWDLPLLLFHHCQQQPLLQRGRVHHQHILVFPSNQAIVPVTAPLCRLYHQLKDQYSNQDNNNNNNSRQYHKNTRSSCS